MGRMAVRRVGLWPLVGFGGFPTLGGLFGGFLGRGGEDSVSVVAGVGWAESCFCFFFFWSRFSLRLCGGVGSVKTGKEVVVLGRSGGDVAGGEDWEFGVWGSATGISDSVARLATCARAFASVVSDMTGRCRVPEFTES